MREDAKRIKIALVKRLEKYKLKLKEEKTRMVRFAKRKFSQNGKQEAFDFLGFAFYLGKSRKGRTIPKVKSCGKRISAKLKKVNNWCDIRNKHTLAAVIWKSFFSKLRGHVQYYGVTFNIKAVRGFIRQSVKILFKWLNRRSQRKSFSWREVLSVYQMQSITKAKNMPLLNAR